MLSLISDDKQYITDCTAQIELKRSIIFWKAYLILDYIISLTY